MPKPTLGDKPIEPQFIELMNGAMGALDGAFNPGLSGKDRTVGIVLLVFPFGAGDGRCNYISNGADRKDIAVMFREQAARFEGQPEIRGRA